MNNCENCAVQDNYLGKVKKAKEVRAVIKVDFARFASAIPDNVKIFACEGVDDKGVYFNWIKFLKRDLRYENYLCFNKDKTLKLFDSLISDRTGLGERVYYFVDTDFDHLQGRAPHERIFVTDKYSIENYFVQRDVLDDILTIDFHCNGYPGARREILDFFESLHRKFLLVTRAINFRIYLAKKLGIRVIDELPNKINKVATVSLIDVAVSEIPIPELVKLEREPTPAEVADLFAEFLALVPEDAYRGKFSLAFFIRWLEFLRRDRQSDESIMFAAVPPTDLAIRGNFSIETLSPKVAAPSKLNEFLQTIS